MTDNHKMYIHDDRSPEMDPMWRFDAGPLAGYFCTEEQTWVPLSVKFINKAADSRRR